MRRACVIVGSSSSVLDVASTLKSFRTVAFCEVVTLTLLAEWMKLKISITFCSHGNHGAERFEAL